MDRKLLLSTFILSLIFAVVLQPMTSHAQPVYPGNVDNFRKPCA